MKEKLEINKSCSFRRIKRAVIKAELEDIRVKYLGKKVNLHKY